MLKIIIRDVARRILRLLGQTTVSLCQTYDSDRNAVFKRRRIDLVIDVGANVGQYALALRRDNYRGRIISLEPLPAAFSDLKDRMAGDRHWSGHQVAAGEISTSAEINVSEDSVCSSLLNPSESLKTAIKTARIVDKVEVDVITLDSLQLPSFENLALKLDVQGFERQAMRGGSNLISRAAVLEVELAIEPGYKGAYKFEDAYYDIVRLGFTLVSIGRGVSDAATGKLIDVDVLFERNVQLS